MKNSATVVIKDIKRVYISGQISGIKLEYAKQNFHFACKEVSKYHEADFVVNPFFVEPFLGIKHWPFYMINDIRKQKTCTHSAFQKNWLHSKGAVIEYFFAKFIFKQQIIWL
jgi:hypothetical protein